MLRYLLIVIFYISSLSAIGQEADSIIAVRKGNNLAIKYIVKSGENMSMLAKRFYVSDGALAYANEVEISKKINAGDVIFIPVTKDNYRVNKQPLDDLFGLYYHVGPKDDIGLISTYAGVTKSDMIAMNNLHGNSLSIGQALFVGWIKMISRDTSNPIKMLAYPVVKKPITADTAKAVVFGGLDTVFNRQTYNGMSVLTEKGTAVFFDKAGKNNVYFAFHNATPRGTVIKVFNPGTGKTIYVKVLDKIPPSKLYSNCIIGISTSAREALGVTDNKAWVEISYPAN